MINDLRLLRSIYAGHKILQVDERSGKTIATEREREVHAFEQGAGVYPAIGGVGIAGRRLAHKQPFAHLSQPAVELRIPVRVGADGANRADSHLKRSFNLDAII